MNTQELARHLLNRQNAGPLVFPGELIAAIGSPAVQEGLERRWLVPEHDSGMLKVNTDGAVVEDMRTTAGTDFVPERETAAPENTSHKPAFEHARRWHDGSDLQELLSPGTGTSPDNGLKMGTPPIPPTPTTPPRPRVATTPGAKPVGVASKTPEGNLEVTLGKDQDAAQLAQQIQTAR
jgi:hypothetical protein